jgi:hypothetical protein
MLNIRQLMHKRNFIGLMLFVVLVQSSNTAFAEMTRGLSDDLLNDVQQGDDIDVISGARSSVLEYQAKNNLQDKDDSCEEPISTESFIPAAPAKDMSASDSESEQVKPKIALTRSISQERRLEIEEASKQRTAQERHAKETSRTLNPLIMALDDGSESTFGAITIDLSVALEQKVAPILASGTIILNYLTQTNSRSSLSSFNLDEWEIYKCNRLYLFIPKTYDRKLLTGLRLSGDGITPVQVQNTEELVNLIQYKLQRKTAISLIVGKDIEPFFAKKVPQEEMSPTEEQASWVIYLTGHGSGGENPQIAGLTFNGYIRFLKFLSQETSTSLLYVSTCFGGGYALDQVKAEVNTSLNEAGQGMAGVTPDFPIVIGALTDAPSSAAKAQANNLKGFFRAIKNYLNGILTNEYFEQHNIQSHDPIAFIAGHLEKHVLNTPNLWIPKTGFTKAVAFDSNVIPITKSLVIARSLELREVQRVIDISNGIGLLYGQEIPITLKVGSNGGLISMTNNRVHILEELVYDGDIVNSARKTPLLLPPAIVRLKFPLTAFLVKKHRKTVDDQEWVGSNQFIIIEGNQVLFIGTATERTRDLITVPIQAENHIPVFDAIIDIAIADMKRSGAEAALASLNILFQKKYKPAFEAALNCASEDMQSDQDLVLLGAFKLLKNLIDNNYQQALPVAFDAASAGILRENSQTQQAVLDLLKLLVEKNYTPAFDLAVNGTQRHIQSNNDQLLNTALNLLKLLVEKNHTPAIDIAIDSAQKNIQNNNDQIRKTGLNLFNMLFQKNKIPALDSAIDSATEGMRSQEYLIRKTAFDLFTMLIDKGYKQAFDPATQAVQMGIQKGDERELQMTTKLFFALIAQDHEPVFSLAIDAAKTGMKSQNDVTFRNARNIFEALFRKKYAPAFDAALDSISACMQSDIDNDQILKELLVLLSYLISLNHKPSHNRTVNTAINLAKRCMQSKNDVILQNSLTLLKELVARNEGLDAATEAVESMKGNATPAIIQSAAALQRLIDKARTDISASSDSGSAGLAD